MLVLPLRNRLIWKRTCRVDRCRKLRQMSFKQLLVLALSEVQIAQSPAIAVGRVRRDLAAVLQIAIEATKGGKPMAAMAIKKGYLTVTLTSEERKKTCPTHMEILKLED